MEDTSTRGYFVLSTDLGTRYVEAGVLVVEAAHRVKNDGVLVVDAAHPLADAGVLVAQPADPVKDEPEALKSEVGDDALNPLGPACDQTCEAASR
jgi:hypothetical protein